MKELHVAVVGDIAWNHDVTPTDDKLSIGGAAYYSSVGAAYFSNQVGVIARIGGDFEPSVLKDKGIDIQGLKILPNEKTCRFELVQYTDGNRDFEAFEGVASIVDVSIIWLDALSQYKNISVDSFELYVKQFPDLTRFMFKRANMIFTNENEWQTMKGFGDNFADKPMIIKRGKNGAVYKHFDKEISIPAPQVTAVDFSGAGDVLAGAFLALRAQDVPIEIALRKAVNLASYSVTKFGVEHIVP